MRLHASRAGSENCVHQPIGKLAGQVPGTSLAFDIDVGKSLARKRRISDSVLEVVAADGEAPVRFRHPVVSAAVRKRVRRKKPRRVNRIQKLEGQFTYFSFDLAPRT